jgi:hypothetical protein
LYRNYDVVDVSIVSNIANVIFYARIGIMPSHIVLFLLIPAEDANLLDFGLQQALAHSVTERAGAPGDKDGFIRKGTV